RTHAGGKRVLIYGAGEAGMTVLREIQSNTSLGYRVAGFLDDDSRKRSFQILGVSVIGSGRRAAEIVLRSKQKGLPIEEILVAIPSTSGSALREVLANCRAAGVPSKIVPGVGELLSGRVLTSQMREVSPLDLLGREPVRLDQANIRHAISGKNVLVTGGAGSIGSEICRQLTRFAPAHIVALDQAETDLYKLELEFSDRFPSIAFIPQVGDIRNPHRVNEVLRSFNIHSVFHAAAYKHVPMMENHLVEAVCNNVLGTSNLVEAAYRHRVESFLMISSDKAVNPTNLMGTTKRVAELIVSSMPMPERGIGTKFVSVRFGNVLGSNGSVIPLFRQQIAAGGPVTVTHPEMRRYFMTIPEAAQLVLQASTMGRGSEVFELDMGEPIKIADLARNMIRLSGREPDKDIEIRFTGLRPGEKLFEELSLDAERIEPSYHEKIHIFRGKPLSRVAVRSWVDELEQLIEERDECAILHHLKGLVPEYRPVGKWAAYFESSEPQLAPLPLSASA
ncbi:MAG: polysaccharide biosynthesis protein, partial [Acidobacteriaceae bacterium]|nr:polysaccharide biosynthesis protein [Acidobacteriaceae bacterium]